MTTECTGEKDVLSLRRILLPTPPTGHLPLKTALSHKEATTEVMTGVTTTMRAADSLAVCLRLSTRLQKTIRTEKTSVTANIIIPIREMYIITRTER